MVDVLHLITHLFPAINREIDVRGTYTVISIASLLNMLTPELVQGVAEFLLEYVERVEFSIW